MTVFAHWMVAVLMICSLTAAGQCTYRDSVLKKMRFGAPTTLPVKEELSGLIQVEKKLADCSTTVDSVYTWLMIRIGLMYFLISDYEQAIQYTHKAVAIIRDNKQNPKIEIKQLIRSYYYLSIYYDSLKMTNQRNEFIDSCVSLEIKKGISYDYSVFLLVTSVKSLYYNGDYTLAVDHAALGESLTHAYYHFPDSADYITFFISYKAMSLFGLERYTEADAFLQEKMEQLKHTATGDYAGVIYLLFGYLNKSKGNYKDAVRYFERAWRQDTRTPRKSISAEALCEAGKIYNKNFHRPDMALQYFAKASKYSNQHYLSWEYDYIGNIYAALGKYDSAYGFYVKAFNAVGYGIDEKDILLHTNDYITNNTAETLLNMVLDKGDLFFEKFKIGKQQADLQEALLVYRNADQLITRLKNNQAEDGSKLFWRAYAKHLYEHAIEACYQGRNNNGALYFFEKSRAVLLEDEIRQEQHIDEQSMLALTQAKKNISRLENANTQGGNYKKPDMGILQELFLNRKQVAKTENLIKIRNPLYFQVFLDSSFINIDDIRNRLLKTHQAALEFFNGDSAVYTLQITSKQVSLNRIEKAAFDSTLRKYNNYVFDPAKTNAHFDDYIKTSSLLNSMIFSNHSLPPGRIIISTDGQYFPFEALVTGMHGRQAQYFINDHAVSYTYSLRFLMNKFIADSTTNHKNFIGVAPVQYAASFELSPLPGSDHSLKNISTFFGNAVNMTSSNATRNNFLKNFYRYKIIQLYTHASQNGLNNEPVIYFADSAIRLSELSSENKTLAKLIVLSACETGAGKSYSGEGVFSFNRGFAALGIPSSITNLWSVDNESTYKLTELFYKYLSQNLPLDIALQKAKLEYMSDAVGENQLPYYWAAPILVGKTDPIVFDKPFPWKYILIVAGLAGLALLAWKKIRKPKSLTPAPGTIQTAA